MATKQRRPTRERKSYFQAKQAAKIEDPERFSVYISRKRLKRIHDALEILGTGTLSGFCGEAAVERAEHIIADHKRKQSNEAVH